MRIHLSKKQITIFGLIVGLVLIGLIVYQLTSLWEPDQSLITLLPQAPICYVSVKELKGFIQTFQRSQFGKQVAQTPILAEIQREAWWKQVVYQKQLWEYEMGGKLDLNKIGGYFGEEAILGFYKRGNELSFLLITAVGAKEKLEIATLTATDVVNPKYKRLKENYRQLDINTITGYPRDFSYAFIGKIGLLSTDKALIQDTIDIYAQRKQSFTDLQPTGDYLREQYNANQNAVYVNPSKLPQIFTLSEQSKSLLADFDLWTCNNHYKDGVIHSRHKLSWNRLARRKLAVHPIDRHVLSVLPATTAVLGTSSDQDLTKLWKEMKPTLALQHSLTEINLIRHLDSKVAGALLSSSPDGAGLIPPIVLIFPIRNQEGLTTDLAKLSREKIAFNGKTLQFLEPQNYQGIDIQPIQIRLGLLLSLKGGYAIIDKYWVVSLTFGGLKSAIDALTVPGSTLADLSLPAELEKPSYGHLLIQPDRFIPELKRLMPVVGLLVATTGQQIDSRLTKRITDNLFPLEALGPIIAGIDSDGNLIDAEVRIVLEHQHGP